MAHERSKLRELYDRNAELEKVERSIMEVRDMFIQIRALVIDQVSRTQLDSYNFALNVKRQFCLSHRLFSTIQSPLIMQIEYFAHQATLNIDKGASKLEKARRRKIKRMKVSCFFVVVVVHVQIRHGKSRNLYILFDSDNNANEFNQLLNVFDVLTN